MKTTYERTMFHPDLTKTKIRIFVYDKEKYDKESELMHIVEYNGITAWDIISGGVEADEVEVDLSDDEMDAHHEYLVLHLTDGGTATFRNSYINMFFV